MINLTQLTNQITRVSVIVTDVIVQRLLFPMSLAIALGTGVWSLFHVNQLDALLKNTISKNQRINCVLFVVAAAVIVGAIYGFLHLRYRKQHDTMPAPNVLRSWNRLFSFLFAVPFWGILMTRRIAEREGIFAVLLIVAASVVCFPTIMALLDVWKRYRSSKKIAETSVNIRRPWQKYLPEMITCALFVAYSFHLMRLSVNNLHALNTRMGDMSIYTNVFYHSIHGDWLGSSLVKAGTHASSHFDPILVLLSPLFLLNQRPELLLQIQAIWFGLGIFPLFLIGNRILENKWAGVVVAVVYALHPNVHFANLCEFHSLALVGTPLLWGLYFLEAGYFRRFFAILPILLFVREDVSLLMCFVAITFILTNRKNAWVGVVTIFVSLAYLIVIKKVFMTSDGLFGGGKNSTNFMGYFDYLIPHRNGFTGMAVSVLTNPVYAFKYLFSLKKLELALRFLGPMLFLPLFAGKRLFMAVYGLIFIFLSSRRPVFSPYFHYQMVILPILIFLIPYGIKRIIGNNRFGFEKSTFMSAINGTLLISAILSGIMVGTLSPKKIPRQFTYTLSSRQQKLFETVEKYVSLMDKDASVLASYSVAPFVAVRRSAYVLDFYRPKKPTDYILLDRKKTNKKHLEKLDRQIEAGVYKALVGRRRLILYKHVGNRPFLSDVKHNE